MNFWPALSFAFHRQPSSFVSTQLVDFSSQNMFALLSTLFPLFNLCKAGISWTSRSTVCFFLVFFFNSAGKQQSSLMPEYWLTDDSQEWPPLCQPSFVYGPRAQCGIKVLTLSHKETPPSLHFQLPFIKAASLSVRSLETVNSAKDLKGNQLDFHNVLYLLQRALDERFDWIKQIIQTLVKLVFMLPIPVWMSLYQGMVVSFSVWKYDQSQSHIRTNVFVSVYAMFIWRLLVMNSQS